MSLAPLLAVLLVPLGHADPYGSPDAHAPRTEAREVADFDTLSSAGPFDVVVTLGQTRAVSVTCDADLVARIETVVDGGELTLRVARHSEFHARSPCRVEVAAPRLSTVQLAGSGDVTVHGPGDGLESLVLAGSGNLTVDAAQVDDLSVDLAGSGDVHIAGTAKGVTARVAGSGDIDLRQVHVARATVMITGSGDVSVAADERVDAHIVGSGDVLVHGHPEVHEHVMGSGRVRIL